MTNVRTIHVDWYSQRPPRFDGGPQLAYQGDHLSNMVVFDNAPELPNYYLLVKMKTDDEGPIVILPEIQLEGPYWVIPNYYTQICQQITYQVCCKTESGDYEHHSSEFKGTIFPAITHNGEPIDQSPMFDPYIDILDKRVDELVIAAGDIQIDSELKSDSVNPVQNKVVKTVADSLAHVSGYLYSDINVTWESGGVNNNNGGNTTSENYIRTKYYRCVYALEVTVPEGYMARVAVYTAQGGTAGFIGWLDNSEWTGTKYYQFSQGRLWRLRLRKESIEAISTDVGANVTFKLYRPDPTLTQENAPADAKAVGDIVNVLPNTYLPIASANQISASDDLNDYVTPGAYRSPSTAVTKTLVNCPFPTTGFLMYVFNTANNTDVEQIIIVNTVNENRIYHRVKNTDWSRWYSLTNSTDMDDASIDTATLSPLSASNGTEKLTINIATYNIYRYRIYGDSDKKIYEDPVYINNYRKFLMNNGIDILFLQECEDTIDASKTVNAFDYLYKYFFLEDHNIDAAPEELYVSPARRKILTRLPFASPSTELTSVVVPWTYAQNWNGYYSWVVVSLAGVGRILLINVHNFAHTQAEQIANRKFLLTQVETLISAQSENYDYFIIAGDFNTATTTDRDNLLDFCGNINGTPVNGGMIGWFETCGGSAELSQCLDNVIVSNNIRINSIKVKPYWKQQLFSDHIPVLVSLTFL